MSSMEGNPSINAGLGHDSDTSLYTHLDVKTGISAVKFEILRSLGGAEDNPTYLNNLGNLLQTHFKSRRECINAKKVLSDQEKAVEKSHGYSDKMTYSVNLRNSLQIDFEYPEAMEDIRRGISTLEHAVVLLPNDHPDIPSYWNNIGILLQICFKYFGEMVDLENAILHKRRAVLCISDDHPAKPKYLNSLGISLWTQFQCLGEIADIEKAVSNLQKALQLTPDEYGYKPMYLNNLGILLQTRFEHLGEMMDIEAAVSNKQLAVLLTPDEHIDKPAYLNDLGHSLLARFKCLREIDDLDKTILNMRRAVQLTPYGYLHKPMYLNNLGISLQARFEFQGEMKDIEEALSNMEHAVLLTSDGHPDKPKYLSNLAIFLQTRFICLGNIEDIEKAISNMEKAVLFTPDGHPHKPIYLSDLGSSLQTCFKCLGKIEDIEKAITNKKKAVLLTSDRNVNKPKYLNDLGRFLQTHFENIREIKDLEEGISFIESAVLLTPDGNPHKPMYLNNLATLLHIHFEHLGEIKDIEKAISNMERAVLLTPDSHPDKPLYINNLGISLQTLKHFTQADQQKLSLNEPTITPDSVGISQSMFIDTRAIIHEDDTDVTMSNFPDQFQCETDHPERGLESTWTNLSTFVQDSTSAVYVVRQYVAGAQNALNAVLSNREVIEITLRNYGVSNDKYFIQVGFNEDLIHHGIGHLEEVYINVAYELSCSAGMLTDIGKILSPLTCIIFTTTNMYRTPVFLDHSHVESLDFEDVVLTLTDRTKSGPVIECQSANGHTTERGHVRNDENWQEEPADGEGEGSSSNGRNQYQQGDGRNGNDDMRRHKRNKAHGDGDDENGEIGGGSGGDDDDGGGGGDDPHSNGEQQVVPADIEVVAKIWIGDLKAPYQEFRIQTALFPKAQSKLSEKDFSVSQINFRKLIFQIRRQGISNYEQTRAEVSVGVNGSFPAIETYQPHATLAKNRVGTVMQGHREGGAATISLGGNGIFLSANGERTRTQKDIKPTSRITFTREDSSCLWGFNVGDEHEREEGMRMERGDENLPSVTFYHRPAGQPAATKANIRVAAYWKLPKPTKFWRRGGVPPAYRNLCQVLEIELPMKFDKALSTKLELNMHIPAALNADVAQCTMERLLHPGDEDLTVSSTIDQEQLVSRLAATHM